MGAEIIAALVALILAVAGWIDSKTKAIKAENSAKKIMVDREENKLRRDDQLNAMQNQINLLEKDVKSMEDLASRVDKINDTLIELKTMVKYYFENRNNIGG